MSEKILVVDDEESLRFTFRTFLEQKGYEVAVARDYREALERLDSSQFDLVYADIILGGKTGVEVLREVKKRDPNCPVIMITGVPTVETSADSVRHGAFDYIPKPIRRETLLRVTGMALQHRTLLDEKERYRANLEAIFKGIRDAIILVDEDLTIIEANRAVRDVCTYAADEVVGKLLYTLPLFEQGSFAEAIEKTIREKKPVDIKRLETEGGHLPGRVYSISTTPLISEQDKFFGAVILVKDETRLAILEKELSARQQFHNIVGKSARMQEVYSLIESLEDVDSTVLITGESGTGKELVAEALHFKGERREMPLLKVNCSALTESLLESELFGHVKGAFTGAVSDRAGRFQSANGGTIFMDEIGDITPALQLRLLRVLQNKEIEKVGDSTPIKVDVRVIAATNRDLRRLMREGKFREDLYYRLRVVEISVPSLVERREDIPLLLAHFLEKLNKKLHREVGGISEDVLKLFMSYSWPGNVRELEHTLEHALIVCQKGIITREDLPAEILEHVDSSGARKNLGQRQARYPGIDERVAIMEALVKTGWNKSKAARFLGISRRTIYRKMEQYGIDASKPDM